MRTALLCRTAEQADQVARARNNERYLPGVELPTALRVGADLGAALAAAGDDGLIVIATPMSGLREMIARAAGRGAGVWWLCKGFEAGTMALGHEVAREVCPQARVGVLSGPSFALEVARGRPTALVAASVDAALREQAVEAFHTDALRVYTSADPVGVEVGGAVKNVLAIASGIVEGRGLGANATAALITRGFAEMARLGLALGAELETLTGLSGLGDLVLTCHGPLSRNRALGEALGRGDSLAHHMAGRRQVVEGEATAPAIVARAARLGIEMPISAAVDSILHRGADIGATIEALLSRPFRSE